MNADVAGAERTEMPPDEQSQRREERRREFAELKDQLHVDLTQALKSEERLISVQTQLARVISQLESEQRHTVNFENSLKILADELRHISRTIFGYEERVGMKTNQERLLTAEAKRERQAWFINTVLLGLATKAIWDLIVK